MAENDLYILIISTGYISAYYFVLPFRRFFHAAICGRLLVFIAIISLFVGTIEVVSANAKGFVEFALPWMTACVALFGVIGMIHRAITLPRSQPLKTDGDVSEDD